MSWDLLKREVTRELLRLLSSTSLEKVAQDLGVDRARLQRWHRKLTELRPPSQLNGDGETRHKPQTPLK